MSVRAALALLAAIVPVAGGLAQDVRYLSTDEALSLEHQTRFARMRRIAQEFGVFPPPEFHDYQVPSSALPPSFPHDVPVLRIVFPENVFFDTASATLKPQAQAIVRAMAAMLDGDVPDVTVFVAGHADARGSDVYNHNLSVERARAVARLLNDLRQRPGAVWSIGFGKSVPLFPNTSDVNMGYNRRVELLLSARIEAVATWLQDQAGDICRTSDAVERVRCMTDFKRERKIFEAEEVLPARKVRLAERNIKVSGATRERARSSIEGNVQRVEPQGSTRLKIHLNERRIYVKTIEH
ncbi:OmpA family protein [Sphingomonas sp. ID1715]|uniref:OmpA family protein n=1 Tax=Sphingomonas sp. ID1715 TaxID=1656898 RepID=UPI0014892813|nr:OmpA family protein [Sphingomonas sp. ID1715]NNM75799.1 OmpA family protein [Sphingomonas sp. ID1715]